MNTDTRTELEKLYDKAYQQGFNHCKMLFESFANKLTPEDISKVINEFIAEKFPAVEAASL